MSLNKEIIKKIEIVFIIFVIYMIIFSAVEFFIEGINELNVTINMDNIPKLIWMFIMSIGIGIFKNIILVAALIAVLLASKSLYKAKLDETDFEKNKNYYRDIIKEYSISALNYIDKFTLDKKQSYTAKLLELEKKKIIKIEDKKIIVIGKPTDEMDIKFIDSIKDNKVTMSLSEYEDLIINEAVQKDLISKTNAVEYLKNNKIVKYGILFFTLLFIGSFVVSFIFGVADPSVIMFIALIVLSGIVSLLMVFFVVFAIAYSINLSADKGYRRTSKGKEINKQLDGLKLFMEEFSNINNKESKHLVLWDEYLIYSVMFDINKKIQEEYSKYFD